MLDAAFMGVAMAQGGDDPDADIQIVPASRELGSAVRATACRDMAHGLIAREMDLIDSDAVIDALLDAGFGKQTIAALWKHARELALILSAPTEGNA